jgi:hypothetical protein
MVLLAYGHALRAAEVVDLRWEQDGHDTRGDPGVSQASEYSEYTRYTALAPQRFKEFFRD